MFNFILLGYVPGTDFQITFSHWLQVLAAIIGVRLALYMRRRRTLLWLSLIWAFFALSLRDVRIERPQRFVPLYS